MRNTLGSLSRKGTVNVVSNFYLTVDSDNANNLAYYPDNEAWKFKVHLDILSTYRDHEGRSYRRFRAR